ncbi:hypothetical protein GPJ56_008495 [Histomonas meleagridis]|uniref:uncharacterized protein n=1 Tax=Histomonas meleagridis TaxID=135588 RepID=UPI00355A3609|nr:hypothetical protein GPJ56_008495 [Histomonas meleagridis]KAH0797689.1 hypothetical protein GO595_009318 [Histomonas meleagridis]
MWKEEQNHYVRAPTPSAFDKMVEKYEDVDSVMFESISLPNIKNEKKEKHVVLAKLDLPVQEEVFSDDFIDDENDEEESLHEDQIKLEEEVKRKSISERNKTLEEYKEELHQLEIEGNKKSELLRRKDRQILQLQRELAEAEARKHGKAMKIQQPRESVAFYRDLFEKTLLKFENLKKSLKEDGKLRMVSAKTARVYTPRINSNPSIH